MNVTESGFKNRQPHMEDYLQIDEQSFGFDFAEGEP